MNLQTRLTALAQRIAQEINKLKRETGTVSITVPGGEPGGTTTLTFNKTYTVPPLVMVCKHSSGAAKTIPYVNAPTTTQATVGVYTGDGNPNHATNQATAVVAYEVIPLD